MKYKKQCCWKVPKDIKNKIIAEVMDGLTYAKAGKKYKLNASTIYNWLLSRGLISKRTEVKQTWNLSPIDKLDIIDKIEVGISRHEIAKQYNIHKHTVDYYARRSKMSYEYTQKKRKTYSDYLKKAQEKEPENYKKKS